MSDVQAKESIDPRRSGTRRWAIVWTVIALASLYAFLQDLIAPDWPAWVLSPLIIVGFHGAVSIAPSDSIIRAGLYQAALLLVPFMGVYLLADAAFSAEWPAWVIASAVVLLLWAGVAIIAEAESD